MEQADSLPLDIVLKIVSSLQELEVCALGSCSRSWRELCGSDCIWESLTRKRWPTLPSSSSDPIIINGWREVYIRMHREMAGRVAAAVDFVEKKCCLSGLLEVWDYSRAITDLGSAKLTFTDVQMFLFKPNLNVILNLVGVHYCLFSLKVPAEHVMEALVRCKISERQVSVKWGKPGRWFYGFCTRDESHSHWISLADLATEKGEEIRGVISLSYPCRLSLFRSLLCV